MWDKEDLIALAIGCFTVLILAALICRTVVVVNQITHGIYQ